MNAQPVPDLQLLRLSKRYGAVLAVDAVSLDVEPGEFVTLLGPSGCGKTTLLKSIAGFLQPSEGSVVLRQTVINDVLPHLRQIGIVFQHYALFPHMTVAQNIEYGLRVRGVDRATRRRQARDALDLVRLPGFDQRRPGQLSGGQRQRVALARALVNRPQVLLLDEPLGALDLKLREQMQIELKAIQRDVGITFVFVTHDQDEALTLSDRLAVFNQGRIEQVGTPREVYERPETAFVAGFVGTSNVLTGESAQRVYGEAGTFAIRPERITVSEASAGAKGDVRVTGEVHELVYAGAETRVLVELETGDTVVAVQHNVSENGYHALRRGQQVWLSWSRQQAVSLEGS